MREVGEKMTVVTSFPMEIPAYQCKREEGYREPRGFYTADEVKPLPHKPAACQLHHQ